jgi:regulatory protein SWI6
MAIFLNEDPSHIPELLMTPEPPRDFNTELVIDDQGHTALHWASALARVRVVELLLDRGANMMRTNFSGETALMRACMVVNNYEQKSFDRMLILLEKSLLVADRNDRTFLHHIALTSAIAGREEAASYYLRCTLKLFYAKKELQGLLDVQDVNGDTALTVAARGESKIIVEQLIEAGASTQVANNNGIRPEDYEEKDEVSRRLDIVRNRHFIQTLLEIWGLQILWQNHPWRIFALHLYLVNAVKKLSQVYILHLS